MSKKKTKIQQNNYDFPTEGTLMEQFNTFIKKYNKINDIIAFLSVSNASFLALHSAGAITENKKEELIDFYEYFMENFGEVTFEARMHNWGQEPLVFRMGEQFLHERYEKQRKQFFKSLSKKALEEASSLCDILFQIRKERHFSFVTEDYAFTFSLEKTIPKVQLKEAKDALLYTCAIMISGHGAVTVRCIDENSTEIFGIKTNKKGLWVPISKKAMLDAHTMTPNGIRIAPEEGVAYTQIERNFLNKQ